MYWFGDPWRAFPCYDELNGALNTEWEIDIPVGRPCEGCGDPIADGERGVQTLYGLHPARAAYLHAECFLREITGSIDHHNGHCACYGVHLPDGAKTSYRDSARAVFSRIMRTEP